MQRKTFHTVRRTFSLSVSRAEVASSSRRIFGFLTSARAIATRCFCPPLSCVPLSPTFVSYFYHKTSITLSKTATCYCDRHQTSPNRLKLPAYDQNNKSKVNDFYLVWQGLFDFLLVINSNLGFILHRLATIHPSVR